MDEAIGGDEKHWKEKREIELVEGMLSLFCI